MLKILNNLSFFIEDNYRRISVREYAKIANISPPTASKQLDLLWKEKLLIKETDKQYIYYSANRDSWVFLKLSQIYWLHKLVALKEHLEKSMIDPVIILFGSLSKCETRQDSDIDVVVVSRSDKELDISNHEKQLKRKIHLLRYDNWDAIPKDIYRNIINGVVISGRI
ncbi:MAG: nucleotidyltransferase domain-containing protein [archaeon]